MSSPVQNSEEVTKLDPPRQEFSISPVVIQQEWCCSEALANPYHVQLVVNKESPSDNKISFIHVHHGGKISFCDIKWAKYSILPREYLEFPEGSVMIELGCKGSKAVDAYMTTFANDEWFSGHKDFDEDEDRMILFVAKDPIRENFDHKNLPVDPLPVEELLHELYKYGAQANSDLAQEGVARFGVATEDEYLDWEVAIRATRRIWVMSVYAEHCKEYNESNGALALIPDVFDEVYNPRDLDVCDPALTALPEKFSMKKNSNW